MQASHRRHRCTAGLRLYRVGLFLAEVTMRARGVQVDQGETIRHYTGHHKAVICVALHDRSAGELSSS